MASVCEVCEKATSEPVIDPEEGFAFCPPCAVGLLGAERDGYRVAIEEALTHLGNKAATNWERCNAAGLVLARALPQGDAE